MGLHKPFDRAFYVVGGATMTDGYSLNLTKGQFGIFDIQNTNVNGAKAVNSFLGQPKNKKYELKMGVSDLAVTRSQTNKSFSSFPFSVNNVLDLTVSVPESTEQQVDEVIVGYNGIDEGTAITFKKGDRKKLVLRLEGEPIGLLGYPNGVDIPVYMDAENCPVLGSDCEDCDPCEAVECLPIVLDAIEKLKRHQLRGGTLVSDYVDITPIRSCETSPTITEIPYDFYCLEVCDTGDDSALAMVQAQYPNYKILRVERNGAISKYQFLAPQADGAPADYSQTLPSIIKGCDTCPVGYTEVEGGIMYAVTIEDEGIDVSATIETLANASVGTAIKAEGQNAGVGFYTVVLTEMLSDTDFNTFITANPTATIEYVGTTVAICNNDTVTDTAWAVCGTCNATTQSYTLDLPDTVCGTDRLAELQSHYPNLTVDFYPSDNSTRQITLAGTSGTANISVAGTPYLVTFATNLTTTASNFVTANAALILSATGTIVTSNGAVLTFTDATTGFPTIAIANVSGNLSGALGAVTAIPLTGGCQTRYQTTVVSNIVCDECDPIFLDSFNTVAPSPYTNREWKIVAPTASTDCLCGIKIKGKILEVHPDECLRDELGFVDSSVLVRASGGFLTEVREGIGETVDRPFNVEYKSNYIRRTHLGGNLWNDEDRDRRFFSGEQRHEDRVARLFKGEESNLIGDKQYVDYALTVRRNHYSQSFSGLENETITYHIQVEVGRHQAVEAILNKLATAAGLNTVKAFGI